jgi:diguanylate cyclase (GGDEF)-like protein
MLISLLKHIDESEHVAIRFAALRKAFLSLTAALPKTALPANSELSSRCKEDIKRVTVPLAGDPPVTAIDEAGGVALQQIEEICLSNKAAFEERDAALKGVVATVAEAISHFKGHSERHQSKLGNLANDFDVLSRLEDATELRRRLNDNVFRLRESLEEMRRENEESVTRVQSQVSVFQERMEKARKESEIDRLTGLGSRREAERQLQEIPKRRDAPCLLLYDINDFREINSRSGTAFGDKVLRALAHILQGKFPEEGTLFRWGPDEFLVIAEGSLPVCLQHSRDVRNSFRSGKYITSGQGPQKSLGADLAFGGAQYVRGETTEDLYRRARQNLEENRRGGQC